ncbi:hypothetical protein [Xylophilus sp. ASV27]|uniref:hypothetical protein n=1 Tax=Xylophilus sp. ASV27 TaxID=2795129 RepID=UPI0018ED1034|nr:hypothetical protein [Xylophilus sp. ASV27]
MTTSARLKRIERLVWIFIYGGLLTLVLGVAVHDVDERLGQWLMVGGGLAALVGAGLILWRARLGEDE